ncbi:PepSY domain-containing protein [Breoghania sp.]|uniref:PepSY domain-containing protein n=1 Tax=Breoghania sp. TaxID=2065378 RepID=UPI0026237FBA|nr:PepSY domain-containing protein [Breoghania sp.]MDJ0931914.1 PepSY domain-containing protein [Breoghania sp.]
MGKFSTFACAVLLTAGTRVAVAGTAQASERVCGNAPKAQWMNKDTAKARGVKLGYEVRRVKVERGCYELYTLDTKGHRAELLMNPLTGKIVGSDEDD